jgi:hypothetical protein
LDLGGIHEADGGVSTEAKGSLERGIPKTRKALGRASTVGHQREIPPRIIYPAGVVAREITGIDQLPQPVEKGGERLPQQGT